MGRIGILELCAESAYCQSWRCEYLRVIKLIRATVAQTVAHKFAWLACVRSTIAGVTVSDVSRCLKQISYKTIPSEEYQHKAYLKSLCILEFSALWFQTTIEGAWQTLPNSLRAVPCCDSSKSWDQFTTHGLQHRFGHNRTLWIGALDNFWRQKLTRATVSKTVALFFSLVEPCFSWRISWPTRLRSDSDQMTWISWTVWVVLHN